MDSWWVFPSTLAVGIVGWFVKLEQRLNGKLGIREHETICRESNAEVRDALNELKRLIELREEKASNHRHELRNQVHLLALKVEGIGITQRKDIHDRGQ